MNEHAERPPPNGWWKGPCCSGVSIGNPVAFPAVSERVLQLLGNQRPGERPY
jgi:hypothetical protein